MEKNNTNAVENSWQEINTTECDENSLFDMCSWGEVN